MSAKWFVQKSDAVDGPLNTDEVKSRLMSGQYLGDNLVWGHGLEHWRSLQWWMTALPDLDNLTRAAKAPEAWHYAYQGQSYGPLPRAEFLNQVKNLEAINEVMVWTKGMKEWVPLFEFHDMLTEMGINRRQFPRAEITGKVIVKSEGITIIAQLFSISEGGFGIQLDQELAPGLNLTVELHSQAFPGTIHARAETRYASQGVMGMKFTQISVENKGAIIQYVRQNHTRFNLKAS